MPVVINNASVTLTGGQSDLVSEEKGYGSQRAVLVLTNLAAAGGNTIYVSVGQEAQANKGVPLQPQQSFSWSMDAGYRPPNERIHAYSAGADTLSIYEEVFVRD